MSKNLDGCSPILGGLKSTSLSRHTCHRSPSKPRILTAQLCTRVSSPLSGILIADLFPCYSKVTTYGHLNDTHGLTGLEPNFVNNPFVVAWADTQNPHGSRAGCGPISSIRLWRSTRNVTEETNALNYRNALAEQHVFWQEQSRQALNFQQTGLERAAQEHEQAAPDEVCSCCSCTSYRNVQNGDAGKIGALNNQAEKMWTSHQDTLLNEMIVSQATRWKTIEEVCSMKQIRNFKGVRGKVTNMCKNISRELRAMCQNFINKKSKSNRLREEKKLKC